LNKSLGTDHGCFDLRKPSFVSISGGAELSVKLGLLLD
jgi:hypothetical protein